MEAYRLDFTQMMQTEVSYLFGRRGLPLFRRDFKLSFSFTLVILYLVKDQMNSVKLTF